MRVLSLFSGAGGLSLGLAREGLKPDLAVDINRNAIETYRRNIGGDCMCADVAGEQAAIVREARSRTSGGGLFAIVGGPPCQGFSTAGARQSDDPRNRLVFSYLRLVEELAPRWFLFENVEGLLTSGRGDAIEALARRFCKLGYSIRIEKVNFAGYGLPQARKRVLVVGNRLGIHFELPPSTYAFDGKKHRGAGHADAFTIADALAGLGSPGKRIDEIVPYADPVPATPYEGLMRDGRVDGVSQHACGNYDRDRERISALLPGQSMRDLPQRFWHESYRSRAFRRVMDGMPVERRGGAPAGLRRLVSKHVSLTITSASPREFIHPNQDRPLSLRECARIQSFPDTFEFSGTFNCIALQIGNAFPPATAQVLARWLVSVDGGAGSDLSVLGHVVPPGIIGFKLTEANGMSPALAETEEKLCRLMQGPLSTHVAFAAPKPLQHSLFADETNWGTRMLDAQTRKLITRARTAKPIVMSDRELGRLVAVVLRDLEQKELVPTFVDIPENTKSYYDIPLEWFTQDEQRPFAFDELFRRCEIQIENFSTIFECLTELHKRRRKYDWILGAQPLPTMDQVARRGLLEYGIVDMPALTSWLMWRKWIYDIDNRSAQETGYLFEPILAHSLGGESYGSKGSPITRGGNGVQGRQVDCVVNAADEKLAYEFKARFTIASSGQGRFREELEFPVDCRASGYRPILLVLDETPNDKLSRLVKEFEENGGEAHLGEAVWKHVEERSGKEIAKFVTKYVREPIVQIDRFSDSLLPMSIAYDKEKGNVLVSVGNQSWPIKRLDDVAEMFAEE